MQNLPKTYLYDKLNATDEEVVETEKSQMFMNLLLYLTKVMIH